MKYIPALRAVSVLLLVFSLSFFHEARAQQRSQDLRARIVDLYTKKPVESAHVINMNTLKGANTDDNGFFYIQAALGDSLYETRIYVKGRVKSLGSDCIEKDMRPEHLEELAELLNRAGFDEDPASFKRYGSARQLYNFKVDNASAY